MPVFRIPKEHFFPHPALAEENGLLGVGSDLHPNRLLLAYSSGIFPWYNEGQPILWFSPDPRFVLYPARMHVGRNTRKSVRRKTFEVKMDTAFDEVIDHCSAIPRPGQFGTWITKEMRDAYLQLHELGYAHSIEAWKDGVLVGGLYGVCIGDLFAGESMFAKVGDASKVAFVHFVKQAIHWGIKLIDCQVYTDHLSRFGAQDIAREEYLNQIKPLVCSYREPRKWEFDSEFFPEF